MMDHHEQVAAYIRSRSTTQLLGCRRTVEPPSISGKKIDVYDVRSMVGASYTTQMEEETVIFIDEVATEYALHVFDLAFTPTSEEAILQPIVEELRAKQHARALFAIGDTVEAFILANLSNAPVVSYANAETSISCSVDADLRSRFAADFEAFSLEHELAHVAIDAAPDLLEEYQLLCGRNLRVEPHLFDVEGKEDGLRENKAVSVKPQTRRLFEQFVTAGVTALYNPNSRDELLLDQAFVEELACDLIAAQALMSKCPTSRQIELAEHLVIALFAAFFSRIRILEQAVIEYGRDVLATVDLSTPPASILGLLDGRGGEYTDGDKERFQMIQRFRVRIMTITASLTETLSALDTAQDRLDSVTIRMLDVIALIAGQIASWEPKLTAIAYLAAREFCRAEAAEGVGPSDLTRIIRDKFLRLNNIDLDFGKKLASS
jgi:hypothetical protein